MYYLMVYISPLMLSRDLVLAGDVHLMLTSMLCSVGLNVLRTRSVLVYVHVHAPCSSTTCSVPRNVSRDVSDGVTHALCLTSCWSVSY